MRQRVLTWLYLLSFDGANNEHSPRIIVDSLSWSQLLRVRRIVSNDEVVDRRLEKIYLKFNNRGYPRQLMQRHSNNVRALYRTILLNKNRRTNHVEHIPFASIFSPRSGLVANIFGSYLK